METVGKEKGGRSGADYIQGRVGRIHSCFGGKGLEDCLEQGFREQRQPDGQKGGEGSLSSKVGASLHQGSGLGGVFI